MTNRSLSGTDDPSQVRKRRSTLIACFVHFDFSFMLWVLLGSLGIPLAEAAHLSAWQKGLVVATPLLSGSLLRLPVGVLADRFGGRRVGSLLLIFLFAPLTLAWRLEPSFLSLLAIGLMLGTAGSSFAVALPLASRWFPPDRQGLALGIAAAGNSGTVVTNLVAPRLAARVGVSGTFLVAIAALAVVTVTFALLAHEPPGMTTRAARRGVLPSLKEPNLRWLCFFYAITFGGYVGLSSFLPLLLRDQYGVSPVHAGYITAGLAFLGSGARPIGGMVADRRGGALVLSVLLVPITVAYALESRLPPLGWMVALLGVSMLCLGLGNGAVFQVVPQHFRRDIGAVTGIIGAMGGLGGFLLPTLLGAAKGQTGSFATGFVALALAAGVAALCLRALVAPRGRWNVGAARAAATE
jgi:NNP family nitrate/nitrite transporter-like MFS transporter